MSIKINQNITISDARNATFNSVANTGTTTFQKNYSNRAISVAPVAASITIPCNTGNYFLVAPTEASTVSFSNVPTGVLYAFAILVDNFTFGTAYTLTWLASIKWAGIPPTFTNGKFTMVNFIYDNDGIFYGSYIPNYGI